MSRFRSIPLIAVRRMIGNWRLLSSVVVGTVVAAAILSATAIYSDAIRDLGLDFALEERPLTALDVKVLQSNINVEGEAYQRSRTRGDRAVAAALGAASGGQVSAASSATHFPTVPGAPVSEDADRPRANLRFRSDFEQHVELVAGDFAPPVASATGDALPVVVGEATAEQAGLRVGTLLDLHPFFDEELPPLLVEIVGIVRAIDPDERYWGGVADVLEARERSWQTYYFFVPETTFFGAFPEQIMGLSGDYENIYLVEIEGLNSRNATTIAAAIDGLQNRLSGTEKRVRIVTDLPEVLNTFDEKLFFTRIPLLVLLLQIGGIVAYYLVMVSTMLIERQAAEIALLRSRGATTGQLLVQYGIEGAILAVLAVATGPPLAAATISALGPTPAFAALSGGGPLEVHISTASYVLAIGGALIAFLALMIPAWRATRSTIVEFKRATARPARTPLFLRYYLDVALVLLLAFVFWRLSREEHLFTESLFGETQADPFLLLTPAVFMVTVGIVFLRLFPIVLRMVAWLVGLTRSTAILVGMRSLVRNPSHYTRLVLLLMFATGVGMFGATFSATLDRSYEDRAAYSVGGDVRATDLRALDTAGDIAFIAAVERVPAEAFTPIVRTSAFVEANGESISIEFVGIDPESFTDVGFFRGDFGSEPIEITLATLAANAATRDGVPVPPGTRQIGAWLKFENIRGPISVVVTLTDADGRRENLLLGVAAPPLRAPGQEPPDDSAEWLFFAGDLQRPRTPFGAFWRVPPLRGPLSFTALYFRASGRVAAQQGAVKIGPLLASPVAAPAREETGSFTRRRIPPPPAREVFPDARLVLDFADQDFEIIEGYLQTSVNDTATADSDAPPGFERSTLFQWTDFRRSPAMRGLRQPGDGQPVLFYLAPEAAARLELEIGDRATIFLGLVYVEGELAGLLDLFPTINSEQETEAFAVANGSRLLAAANASPTTRLLHYNEVWFSSNDTAATREVLELTGGAYGARRVTDFDTELRAQQDDPLIAAGWSGILAIAFGAVLLLSSIGFLVYSYLTAQQRGLEFAILRTLGFSRLQVIGVVLLEQLLVIVTGIGLGTLVGLQVGRQMMDLLGTNERGEIVLPPFLLDISWTSIFLAWGILGAVFIVTIAAVIMLYMRLALHRALRIGDA